MHTMNKLKDIIADEMGVVVTSPDSRIKFICCDDKDLNILGSLIHIEFDIYLNLKNFETVGDIVEFIERTEAQRNVN